MIAGLEEPTDARVKETYIKWRYKPNTLRWMTGAHIYTCDRVVKEVQIEESNAKAQRS